MSDIIGTMTGNAKSDLEFTMSDIKGDCGIDIQRLPITRGTFSYQDLKKYRQTQQKEQTGIQNQQKNQTGSQTQRFMSQSKQYGG